MKFTCVEVGNIGTYTLNYELRGKIVRQYSVNALLIFSLVSFLCCLPNIGFFLPCFAMLILNFVASDTFLLCLLAISIELY